MTKEKRTYISAETGFPFNSRMQVLSDMTEGLKNFAAQYNYAINDPDLIRRYRMLEDGKRDVATKISVAEKRGAENEKIQNARGFKQKGVDPEIISSATGLSLDEIAKL